MNLETSNANNYSWDEIITERKIIKKLASLIGVKEDYLMVQTQFVRGINKLNKYIAVEALVKTKLHIEQNY